MRIKPQGKKKRNSPSYVETWARIRRWLTSNFYPEVERERLSSLGSGYVKFIQRIMTTRGTADAIRISKEVRRICMHHLSGTEKTLIKPLVPVDVQGYPKCLGDLRTILNKSRFTGPDYPGYRYLLTVLNYSRSLTLPPVPDLKPITSDPLPSKSMPGDVLISDMASEVRHFWKTLRYDPKGEVPQFSKYHMTTKSGPSGGHALWTSIWDLYNVIRTDEGLYEDIKTLGGPVLAEKMDSIRGSLNKVLRMCNPFLREYKVQPRIRRLSAISDKEGKTRVVAILDYFSQTALRPIHKSLFAYLKRIRQDCTFEQGAFKDKLKKPDKLYHSIDLTNATDRFPIKLISLVLKGAYPSSYIDAWERVMVKYPFWFKDKEVRYAVGNPMGAYSSWASFAITHHFVMFYCCQRLGIPYKDSNYVLLGDDIVIGNDNLALMYKQVLSSLGVEVSELKTHSSEHTYEFAKRWIHHGVEISPFPLAGWLEVKSRYNLLVNVLHTAAGKGWISIAGVGETIADWYTWWKMPSRFRAKILPRAIVCDAITNVIRGTYKEADAIQRLCLLAGAPSILPVLEDGGKYLFQNACVEAFAESADTKKGKWNLGGIAEAFVCAFTDPSFHDDFEVGFALIQSIPFLGVHGQIEETYLGLKKTAFDIDTKGKGDWPLLLRAMTIPVNDRIYSIRNYDVMTSAAATLGHRMFDRINQVLEWYMGQPTIRDPTK